MGFQLVPISITLNDHNAPFYSSFFRGSLCERRYKWNINYTVGDKKVTDLSYLFIYLKAKGHMASSMLKKKKKHTVNQLQLKSDQTLHQTISS